MTTPLSGHTWAYPPYPPSARTRPSSRTVIDVILESGIGETTVQFSVAGSSISPSDVSTDPLGLTINTLPSRSVTASSISLAGNGRLPAGNQWPRYSEPVVTVTVRPDNVSRVTLYR